jgi:hypothetical protein
MCVGMLNAPGFSEELLRKTLIIVNTMVLLWFLGWLLNFASVASGAPTSQSRMYVVLFSPEWRQVA